MLRVVPRKPLATVPIVLIAALGTLLVGVGTGLGGVVVAKADGSSAAKPDGRSIVARSDAGASQSQPGVALVHGRLSGAPVQVTIAPFGLSIEYPVMAQDLGAGACPPPALVAELHRLGSPPLALEGDSQDLSAPSGALSGVPSSWEAATVYELPAAFWSQLHCLLSASGDPLTVGVNAQRGELSWAAQIVAGARSAATAGLDFSIGNEPDLYYLPDYASLATKPSGEDVPAVNLYLQIAAYLQQALGGLPMIGPELATAAHWRGQLPRVIEALHLQTVGVHLYPLSACGAPRAVTTAGLLSPYAANAPRSLAWVVADANAAHVPAIVSEANSASCGGVAGVSDRPAAGVWAVRFVLSALETGFREVRFHFSGGPYDPFVLSNGQFIGRPLASALVALERWLPVGSSLQPIDGVRGLLATAVSGPPAGPEIILDNEHPRAKKLVLRSAQPLPVQTLSPAYTGLSTQMLRPRHDRIVLSVPGNSLLAILS